MNYPWYNDPDDNTVWDDKGNIVVESCVSRDRAERIVACVNACKDITTEHLTQFPNWKLAVGNMARPGDVANLILKLGAYREALEAIVHCLEDEQWQSALSIANEALKP